MKCSGCKYCYALNNRVIAKDEKGNQILSFCYLERTMCKITHICNPESCDLNSDEDVKDMPICFNCKHWIGGGDWGLSCSKDYYNTSSNGFDKACEKFERKDND